MATVMKVNNLHVQNKKNSTNFKPSLSHCPPGGEGAGDRHARLQGRPQGWRRARRGAGRAHHHDDPPTGQHLLIILGTTKYV